MKNVKPTLYISPELEIIAFDCSDVIVTSGGNGPVSDGGEMEDW